MKKIYILMLILNYLLAIDAELDLVRKDSIIPSITIKISKESKDLRLAKKVKDLLEKDLKVSCHFKVNVSNKYDLDDLNFNYTKYKDLDVVVFLNVYRNDVKASYIVLLKIFDLNKHEVSKKRFIVLQKDRYPFLAHKIAIDLNKYIKAPPIDWMSRFVIFSRYTRPRQSEIVVADYTLTYQKVVVKGGLNIFPKWANEEQDSFYYSTYRNLRPTLVKQNLYTSKIEKILSSDGMIACSDVSKDGKKILITMAPYAQPDIYLYDTVSMIKQKITNYKGIDVGGHFVENDKRIVFISDRLGRPNIFAKFIGKKGIEKLVYHGTNNSQVSTYKDLIVYSSRESDNEFGNNIFNLYIISTKSEYIRRLTTLGRNQYPKFSNDGESILYIKYLKGKSYLGIIRYKYNKSFLFKLRSGKLQSIDW